MNRYRIGELPVVGAPSAAAESEVRVGIGPKCTRPPRKHLARNRRAASKSTATLMRPHLREKKLLMMGGTF
jgi:hypothetical protein